MRVVDLEFVVFPLLLLVYCCDLEINVNCFVNLSDFLYCHDSNRLEPRCREMK